MNRRMFDSLDHRAKIEVLNLFQQVKGARQIAFQALVAVGEHDPDLLVFYGDLEQMYEKMAATLGAKVEPVFDERTYVPNPDRCR